METKLLVSTTVYMPARAARYMLKRSATYVLGSEEPINHIEWVNTFSSLI